MGEALSCESQSRVRDFRNVARPAAHPPRGRLPSLCASSCAIGESHVTDVGTSLRVEGSVPASKPPWLLKIDENEMFECECFLTPPLTPAYASWFALASSRLLFGIP